jgi:4-hydroxy-2-oxoheptanedioate aldolase
MDVAPNEFKRRLGDGSRVQWGMFVALADPVVAEICAGSGFDFLVIDNEHGPNDVRTILAQLQATAAYPVETAVRVVDRDPNGIKRILDLGARTIVVPMVESAEQAAAIVRSTRYRDGGTRGTASARAARWGRIPDYHSRADDEICVVVQLESAAAIEQVDSICAVDGVDAAFVGPMDLATSLGHPGGGTLPSVVDIVERTIGRIAAAGCAAGVMAVSPELATRYTAAGARMVATGVDSAVLAAAITVLRESAPPS